MNNLHYDTLRQRMVEEQIAARGVRTPEVIRAMSKVKREGYIPSYLGEFAYNDTALPIEEEQTISQPYIVGYMVEAMQLKPTDRVLEIGTGSGYAAAILAEIAAEVYTIERHEKLAASARERLQKDGYLNVHVGHGDGTLGWQGAAPFDAIVVAAGGPEVPQALLNQLVIGGRLVIPVGGEVGMQKLLCVTRIAETEFDTKDLGDVRFVPLIGAEGWNESIPTPEVSGKTLEKIPELIRSCAEPFDVKGSIDFAPLLERIADSRIVLLGESSHGTSEFYDIRAQITKELIEKRGFTVVAVEADWPDASRIDHYVRQRDVPASEWEAFARFPTWMWRNNKVQQFVDWLHNFNTDIDPAKKVRFAGLDLYGLYNSIAAVIGYLDTHNPEAAEIAKERYACLTPWQNDPSAYGRAVLTQGYQSCEKEVLDILERMMSKRLKESVGNGELWFDAKQNAQLVANGEEYYRKMYYGAENSWNARDQHMFWTVNQLLDFHGPDSKIVVWAHNSHLGDARATEMAARGEHNIGQLCREHFGDEVYSVGFGTHSGTVAASSHWDGPMEIKQVRPSLSDSYEYQCHASEVPAFFLPLRETKVPQLREQLLKPRLQRAIGVIYRPETERASHYFQSVLPRQFDEYIWIDKTSAVHPLKTEQISGMPETYPFGL